jgi:hypothetical protein
VCLPGGIRVNVGRRDVGAAASHTTGASALDDEAWCDYVEKNLGLAVRAHLAPGPAMVEGLRFPSVVR